MSSGTDGFGPWMPHVKSPSAVEKNTLEVPGSVNGSGSTGVPMKSWPDWVTRVSGLGLRYDGETVVSDGDVVAGVVVAATVAAGADVVVGLARAVVDAATPALPVDVEQPANAHAIANSPTEPRRTIVFIAMRSA